VDNTKHMVIYNKTLTTLNTEYSQEVPMRTRKIMIQCRTSVAIRISNVIGKVATPTAPYQTIKSGDVYYDNDICIDGLIYLASGTSGVIAEITCWN